ncbi:MAG TPA: PD-(D/E)XK nuclease-like domain-containing protein [Gemmatimonadaceae bacterium]
MTVPKTDGIYAHIPETVYHGDKGSLSSSGARALLNTTPAEFDHQRREPPNPKPQYDFGHAAHKMVLGEGQQLVRVDADDWRTNAAKEKREHAWAEGKSPLLKKDIDIAQRMAGKVFAHRLAARLLADGSAELSGYWRDRATGVRLRCRPDFVPEVGNGRPILVDYKTSTSASPRHFVKQAAEYGYHNQAAWYIDGFAAAAGVEGAAFLFIVQQKTAPYLVSICQLHPDHVDLGRRQNRRAVDLYAQCVESKTWPAYGDAIHNCELPGWYISQAENALQLV